jgi:hypothetical protein
MKSPFAIAPLLAALLTFSVAVHAADKREARPVGEFSAIGLAAPVKLHLTLGDAPSLALEGPEEALAQIETTVENGSLKIRLDRRHASWRSKVNVYVTARRIEALAISGSGDIDAPALTGEALKLSISGSGDMRIGGKVDGLTASIAGSGDIRAGDLDAQRVNVSISGSGDATVRARQALSVSVAGSGDVRYYGDPTIAKSIQGSGSVRRIGGAAS